MNQLHKKATWFGLDLNLQLGFCHPAGISWLAEVIDERRQVRFCAVDAAPSAFELPPLRAAVPGRAQSQELLLLRSIPVYGLRTADLSREPARYRGLSESTTLQALSLRFSRKHDLAQYPGQCQCNSRLAYLRSVRAATDCHRAQALRQRALRGRFARQCLRTGLHLDRSLLELVPMDSISAIQSWSAIAHLARPAWTYPLVSVHQQRTLCRDQHPGSIDSRARGVLSARPRLPRLHTPASLSARRQFLCYPLQNQPQPQATLLSSSRSQQRADLRSDSCAHFPAFQDRLPRPATAHSLQGPRIGKDTGVLDQPLRPAGRDHMPAVSLSLAHRVVLQVDQAALAHQSLLWHIGECSEDSAVDCGVGLCAHCYRQKAARSARFALRIATDFEPHHVRKNPVATTAYILRAPESIALLSQSTVFVQLTLGHLCLQGEGWGGDGGSRSRQHGAGIAEFEPHPPPNLPLEGGGKFVFFIPSLADSSLA